eukprot:3607279-Amphidinium_carterae.1
MQLPLPKQRHFRMFSLSPTLFSYSESYCHSHHDSAADNDRCMDAIPICPSRRIYGKGAHQGYICRMGI